MTILEALRHGHAGARTKKHLAAELGIPQREVELLVQAARLEGAPIISCAEGYYVSSDPEEIRKCAERLRSRALTQMQTASALRKAADRLPLTLWGGA